MTDKREELLFDARLTRRFLEQGHLTAERLQLYNDGLADVAENAESIDLGALEKVMKAGTRKKAS